MNMTYLIIGILIGWITKVPFLIKWYNELKETQDYKNRRTNAFVDEIDYKLEALRLAEYIIKTIPKFYGSNPSRDYEWHIAEEINGILKSAKEIYAKYKE